jgi:ABC-type nitrate/sulfonate/bicarbonate transport system substrate-binding protein
MTDQSGISMAQRSGIDRRRFLSTGASTLAGAGLAASGVVGGFPARAATTPSIPRKTVTLGTMPFTNHAWVVLMGREGFLDEVGITLEPAEPKVILEHHAIPQLQNGEIDMTTAYVGLITASIDKLPDIKPFHVYSYWAGNAILAHPESGIKTVDEFIDEGLSWEDAARETMLQLKGKQITVPVDPSTYPWMNLAYSFASLTMDDSEVIRIEDPKAVQLGLAGRIPLAAPGGAVQIYQLQFQAGWKVVMSTGQMAKYVPTGTGTDINNVLNYDLFITTQDYIDNNRDTILRMSGAIYRTLDYIFGPQQDEALSNYAPFINAHAGSNLDTEAIKYIFTKVDPFYLWQDQERIWTDRNYSLNYRNIYEYQLQKYREAGTIADRDYDLDDFFQAKSIWEEMRAHKETAERLLQKASAESLSPERQELSKLAQHHLEIYNFLDASRFAEATFA